MLMQKLVHQTVSSSAVLMQQIMGRSGLSKTSKKDSAEAM